MTRMEREKAIPVSSATPIATSATSATTDADTDASTLRSDPTFTFNHTNDGRTRTKKYMYCRYSHKSFCCFNKTLRVLAYFLKHPIQFLIFFQSIITMAIQTLQRQHNSSHNHHHHHHTSSPLSSMVIPTVQADSLAMESLLTPPQAVLVPPGKCQLDVVNTKKGTDGQEQQQAWIPCPLLERTKVSPTSYVLRFGLPDAKQSLMLPTCACILARFQKNKNNDKDNKDDDNDNNEYIIRPYTPISTNALKGSFDLLVKDYGPTSHMSHEMDVNLDLMSTDIEFSHSNPGNVKFNIQDELLLSNLSTNEDDDDDDDDRYNHVVLLAGGTGITPMIQVLHALLGHVLGNTGISSSACGSPTTTSTTTTSTSTSGSGSTSVYMPSKITLLYGSKQETDILAKTLLDRWETLMSEANKDNDNEYKNCQFCVEHVLSQEPEHSAGSHWKGQRGYITQELIEKYVKNNNNKEDSNTNDKTLYMVCGPPPFYDALCGPRDEKDQLKGILQKMGVSPKDVYKF